MGVIAGYENETTFFSAANMFISGYGIMLAL